MGEINLEHINSVKKPIYLSIQDLDKYNVRLTEDELKHYPIIDQWCHKLGLEKSNIPELYSHIFANTVMIQIIDPITNRTICVDENGVKINTNPIGKDFECMTCDHFQKTDKHPNGQCMFAYNRFKERFGTQRPSGLSKLIENSKLEDNEHNELTQEDVLQITGVSNESDNITD